MPRLEEQGPPAILDGPTVELILSGISTEVKCLALGALPDKKPTDIEPVYETIAEESKGNTLHKLTPENLSMVLQRMPERLVTTKRTPKGMMFRKTAAGRLAASRGGLLLRLSADSSMATRLVVGEYQPPRSYEGEDRGDETMGSIASRLVVIRGLHAIAPNRWRPTSELAAEAISKGVTKRSAYNLLVSLSRNGLAEVRQRDPENTSPFSPKDYRLKPKNGHMPPTEIVGRYLKIVDNLIAADSTDYANGLAEMDTILHDAELVPYLVKRSYANSGHSRASAQAD